jgi:hypothetical protein
VASRGRPTGDGPAISVVFVAAGPEATIDRTIAHLGAQTARERIELLVVTPRLDEINIAEAERAGFCDLRVVEVGSIETTGGAFAAGARRAAAPVVACAEEHSYPEPEWAQALISAHEGPWGAVGAALENANPESAISWAHLYTDFGPSVGATAAGETQELAGHHTAYKRDVLLGYGERLEGMLEVEWVLHEDLRARGERLFLEPAARAAHLNVSRLTSQLRSEYQGGRSFAAGRAALRGWSPLRRMVYTAGSPLLPPLRLYRALRDVRHSGNVGLLPRLLPALFAGLLVNAAGQAAGYALGAGKSRQRRLSIELYRHRHLNARDLRAVLTAPKPAR